MQPFAGQDLTEYFPYPLTQGCYPLVTDTSIQMQINNSLITDSSAIHNSGPTQGDSSSALADITWYRTVFLPKIKQYYKGPLVVEPSDLATQGQQQSR
jgi:chitin synthase